MTQSSRSYRLEIFGAFRLLAPDGRRIEIASRRGQALIAMLAVANSGERTRSWLQDRLWGSRRLPQAQASLRRELSTLRALIGDDGPPLISADFNAVRIDFGRLDLQRATQAGELLEGLDLPGEEAFEDWLREQRSRNDVDPRRDAAGPAPLPTRIVDLSTPVPGFANTPAIAILPLQNLTGRAELDYLGDGISEELIERLSRLRWLPVIARSASFRYRDPSVTLREIGLSLGARYVLEGSLRGSAEQVRLGLRVADADSRLTIWSHTSDIPLPFSQATLDETIVEIVGVLDAGIDASEKMRASSRAASDLTVADLTAPDLTVGDLIWRGRWHLHRFTRDDSIRAEACFAEALARAPNSPEALVQLTFFKARSIWTGRKDEAEIRTLRSLAQRAIAADADDGRAYMYAGMAELWTRRPASALMLFGKAVTLNPSLSLAHAEIGSALILDDRPAAALAPLRLAIRLGPNDEHSFYVLGELAMAHCMLARWEEAIDHAEHALLLRAAYWHAHVIKINALVRRGDAIEAGFALLRLRGIKPDFTADFVDWLPFVDRRWNEFLKDGLRLTEVRQEGRAGDTRG